VGREVVIPRRIVYVGGTFDLFHPGHVNFLRQCDRHGRVTVALNTDEFAARYKRPPIFTLEERIEILRACRYVDRVIVNEGDEDSGPAILASGASLVAHGDDWSGESYLRQLGISQRWLDENGIRLLYVPYTQGVSSSEVIDRCVERSGLSAPSTAGMKLVCRCCGGCTRKARGAQTNAGSCVSQTRTEATSSGPRTSSAGGSPGCGS
jgi:glycerol-3-phosphate cytidylyltransferase